MRIKLNWTQLETGERQQLFLETPIAIGSDPAQLPTHLNEQPVMPLVLAHPAVAPYQAYLTAAAEALEIVPIADQPIRVNSAILSNPILQDGDFLQIGPYQIQILTHLTQYAESTDAQFAATGECTRMVGFLIRKRCGRTSKVGCPYCDQGYQNDDPYYYDRALYPDYGTYGYGNWGHAYYGERDRYWYDPATGNIDFTEADSGSLENLADTDFEQDMWAS